jgi:hypothetical protein
MEIAYQAEDWQTLYTALASSTAALTGLLFIALSLNLRAIVKRPDSMALARETLGSLICLLILTILMLIPGQPRQLLGAELIVGSLITIAVGTSMQFRTLKRIAIERRLRWGLRVLLLDLGTTTTLVGGISLIAGQFGGLFWLAPTILIYTVWPLANAWLLVVQVAREESSSI